MTPVGCCMENINFTTKLNGKKGNFENFYTLDYFILLFKKKCLHYFHFKPSSTVFSGTLKIFSFLLYHLDKHVIELLVLQLALITEGGRNSLP